jgi:alpha-beta hydrolase superfamily lysophospholipase
VPESAFYLDVEHGPLYARLHRPVEGTARDVAVLMCSPFGYDDVCSYRSRRVWAQRLAAAGYPTLRFDLPGTGDSGGSGDESLERQTAAVGEAAEWLRDAAGSRRVAGIGIGLGGLLAARAAAAGAPIDDLVLWATPARGKAIVRELRALAAMESSARDASERAEAESPDQLSRRPDETDGAIEVGGFALSREAGEALERIDLSSMHLPAKGKRRALLLGRDGISVDARLARWLASEGVTVTEAPGSGYGEMTGQPHEATPPAEVMEQVERWLGAQAGVTAVHADDPRPPSRAVREVELAAGSGRVREEPFTVPVGAGHLDGILTRPAGEPSSDLCVVFCNVGALRRIGPGRMWVQAARRWAERGVVSARIDVEGIGDADGEEGRYADVSGLYVPELSTQVNAVLAHLAEQHAGRRFAIVGMCSGGYWGFHSALTEERIAAVVMFNPRALIWDPARSEAREGTQKLWKLTRRSQWRRLLRGEVRRENVLLVARAVARAAPGFVMAAPGRMLGRWRAWRAGGDALDHILDRLRDRQQRVVLAFCSVGEPLLGELRRERGLPRAQRWPNIEIELIPGYDHLLRPQVMQEDGHAILDRALERELTRGRA